MTNAWTPKDTTTRQDHVIAHVLGTTFLGYFVCEEALYILLDIGFVWTILLDGEMGLLPHPVAVSELELNAVAKDEIKADIDLLLSNSESTEDLLRMQPPSVPCQIKDVNFFAAGDRRRLVIIGEEANLAIEMSLTTAEVEVMAVEEDENKAEGTDSGARLEDVAQTEHEYLHQRLRDELGREPTEEELDEWLRQHTEGY
ncbi:MAG TPA: hypothetical protein VGO73_04165 [Pyrinomonadaceae bacterium]|nr:hypothetical protein [Pyrinomonadaceae bacterium]